MEVSSISVAPTDNNSDFILNNLKLSLKNIFNFSISVARPGLSLLKKL